LRDQTKHKIEEVIKEKIANQYSVSGGCINDARILHTESGKKYFIKTNYNNLPSMFFNEANGLKELIKADVIKIPKVIYVEEDFILLEAIKASPKSNNFFEDFGRRFARLNKCSEKFFGFYENNYIGSTPQINIPDNSEQTDWTRFYFNKRLKFQFNLAEKNGFAGEELRKAFSQLEDRIEQIMSSNFEKPSLLHGDLWSGNYMIDENGNACLIDPAVYYGNREADLAMTKLFGGFDNKFYSAYQEENPLQNGYEYRENIYKLYHLLNHLNLFGSGYYQQAVSLIKYYL
jgi:protein-ribulosamine 3-kinase